MSHRRPSIPGAACMSGRSACQPRSLHTREVAGPSPAVPITEALVMGFLGRSGNTVASSTMTVVPCRQPRRRWGERTPSRLGPVPLPVHEVACMLQQAAVAANFYPSWLTSGPSSRTVKDGTSGVAGWSLLDTGVSPGAIEEDECRRGGPMDWSRRLHFTDGGRQILPGERRPSFPPSSPGRRPPGVCCCALDATAIGTAEVGVCGQRPVGA